MRKENIVCLFAFLFFHGKIQAQTVNYTYNSTGECTSRVVATDRNKAKSQKHDSFSLSLMKIDIHPYPKIQNEMTIAISNLAEQESLEFSVVDMSGKNYTHGVLHNGISNVPVADLPKGIYLLSIKGNGYSQTYKLIKE